MKEIKIIAETPDYLMVYKPVGVMVHADIHNPDNKETLCMQLLEKYPELEGVGEPMILDDATTIQRPGIIHRLDKDTSGVMIIARTKEMHKNLKTQFKNKRIQKRYHTIVYGHFKVERGIIDRPIGRSRADFRRWTAEGGARGMMRDAQTQYRVMKQGYIGDEKVSLIEVFPKTGRTHQIRVHMRAVGHAIVCDSLYAEGRVCLEGSERMMLHAKAIRFHNAIGELVQYEAEYPADFEKVEKAIIER
jgi:23S rRNA pseudouridine1911/1915/1917 synthase